MCNKSTNHVLCTQMLDESTRFHVVTTVCHTFSMSRCLQYNMALTGINKPQLIPNLYVTLSDMAIP